ncbi:MAG: hypothetical protein V8T45_10355 [Oscillospiraceae bacterium]
MAGLLAMSRVGGIMILALAVRHRTERPAMSMEGGEEPMERMPAAV